jgi:hypothetical protein
MNIIDFDDLLIRMGTLEQAAFSEFEDATHHILATWMKELGLSDAIITEAMPSCLLALGVLAFQRRAEIRQGRVLMWLREQTRNLVVRYWRKVDEQSTPPPKLTVHRVHRQVSKLDGNARTYVRTARRLNVPAGWLRRRHRWLLKRSAAKA